MVLTRNEEGRPADDDEIVLPVDGVETDGGGLQQNDGSYRQVSDIYFSAQQAANLPANCPNSEKPIPMGRISVGKISDT